MKMTHEYNQEEMKILAENIAHRVKNFPSAGKIIFLTGEVGSGKTTFTRFFSQFLGGKSTPSPTFSLLQKRTLSPYITLFHGDFYRVSPERTEEVMDEALEEERENSEKNNIWVLEWFPKSLIPIFFSEVPYISINFSHPPKNTVQNHTSRNITLDFYNPFSCSKKEAKFFLDIYKTPVHIQKHSQMVQKIAMSVTKKLQENKIPVDADLVKYSSLLHDCVKYVDFPEYSEKNRENNTRYQEKITPEKINIWKKTKDKFKTTHHADAMAEILSEKKFFATAQVIKSHKTSSVLVKNKSFEDFSWEELILYYADKRALHDTFVSIATRLADGKIRYPSSHFPKESSSGRLEKIIFLIEKKLEKAGNFSSKNLMI